MGEPVKPQDQLLPDGIQPAEENMEPLEGSGRESMSSATQTTAENNHELAIVDLSSLDYLKLRPNLDSGYSDTGQDSELNTTKNTPTTESQVMPSTIQDGSTFSNTKTSHHEDSENGKSSPSLEDTDGSAQLRQKKKKKEDNGKDGSNVSPQITREPPDEVVHFCREPPAESFQPSAHEHSEQSDQCYNWSTEQDPHTEKVNSPPSSADESEGRPEKTEGASTARREKQKQGLLLQVSGQQYDRLSHQNPEEETKLNEKPKSHSKLKPQSEPKTQPYLEPKSSPISPPKSEPHPKPEQNPEPHSEPRPEPNAAAGHKPEKSSSSATDSKSTNPEHLRKCTTTSLNHACLDYSGPDDKYGYTPPEPTSDWCTIPDKLDTTTTQDWPCFSGCGATFSHGDGTQICPKCLNESRRENAHWEDVMRGLQRKPASSNQQVAGSQPNRTEHPAARLPASSTAQNPTTPLAAQQPTPSVPKCPVCQKKVTVIEVEWCRCRCGVLFCPQHRMPEDHECTYNYKAEGRQQMGKQYPKVIGEKVRHM